MHSPFFFRSLSLVALSLVAACGGTSVVDSVPDASPTQQLDASADGDAAPLGDQTAGHCNDLTLPTDVLSMAHPESLDASPAGGAVAPGTYYLTAVELVDVPAQPSEDTRFGNATLRIDGAGGLQWIRVRDDGQVRRSSYKLTAESSLFSADESCGFPLLVAGTTEKLRLPYTAAGRSLTLFFPAGKTGAGKRVEHYEAR
jgi:hypothetical protein